ncbi:MAG: zinc finger Ran-binding domain-containing protein [Lentisphaeraceae bacterium]|nr:zinc finger Ran-binding domain-containing protein [Lentisphaeraceae bacterium]
MKNLLLSCLFTVVMVSIVGCGPKDPKKEAANYQSALTKAKASTSKYPSFKAAIEKEIANAEAKFKSAETISEPEEKAKAISAARYMLNKTASKIEDIKSIVSSIKTKSLELTGKSSSFTDLSKSKAVAQQAKDIIAQAEAKLNTGASDPVLAVEMLRESEKELESVLKIINGILKPAKPKTTNDQNTKPVTTSNPKPATAPAVAKQWACAYCKSMNKADSVKCANCSAPKSKK